MRRFEQEFQLRWKLFMIQFLLRSLLIGCCCLPVGTTSAIDMKQLLLQALKNIEVQHGDYDLQFSVDQQITPEGTELYRHQLEELKSGGGALKFETPGSALSREEVLKSLIQKAKGPLEEPPRQVIECNVRIRGNRYDVIETLTFFKLSDPSKPVVTTQEFFSDGTFMLTITPKAEQAHLLPATPEPPASSEPWQNYFFRLSGSSIIDFLENCKSWDVHEEKDAYVIRGHFAPVQLPFNYEYQEEIELSLDKVELSPKFIERRSNSGGKMHALEKKIFTYEAGNTTGIRMPTKTEWIQYEQGDNGTVAVRKSIATLLAYKPIDDENDRNLAVPKIPSGYFFFNRLTNQSYIVGDNFSLLNEIIKNEQTDKTP